MIGYAKFDYDSFSRWDLNYKQTKSVMNATRWYADKWTDYFYERQDIYKDCINIWGSATSDMLRKLVLHLSDIGEKMQLFYYDETACIIGYENKRFIMCSNFVTPEYLTDYSDVTSSKMKTLTGHIAENANLPIALNDESVKSLSDQKAGIEAQLQDAKAELKAKEDAIREEMQRKLEEMRAEMAVKMDELNAKIEQYQKELFILESQIFSIRCYTGEVVKFHQIRQGKPAPNDAPLVLYQKIRFLDEELGKRVSIFDFGGEDDSRLIPLLKHRDDIADLLAPPDKSMTILRTSRTGKFIAANEEIKNVLDEYEMYHGMQLALLLRNGENLYIAWCDADNIKINEENAFYSLTKSTNTYSEEDAPVTPQTSVHEALSRYYLFAILQGMVDSKTILNFPEPVNVLNPLQKYIIYSLADGWVPVNRYGSFKDMIDRTKDIPVKKGDSILTVTGLCPTDSYKVGSNDRGIGYANRTHGCYVRGKTIYNVNLVLFDATVEFEYEAVKVDEIPDVRYIDVYENGATKKEARTYIKYRLTDEILFKDTDTIHIDHETFKDIKEKNLLSYVKKYTGNVGHDSVEHLLLYYKDKDMCRYYSTPLWSTSDVEPSGKDLFVRRVTSAKIINKSPHTFVSLKQTGYGSYANNFKESEYNVNFEIEEGEFIPTTFLCSTWIDEVITTGNIGQLRILHVTPSFADILPYLHVLKKHLKERETVEESLLIDEGGDDFVTDHKDWDVLLCEWKIEHEIHTLTPTRAKRFLKDMRAYLKTER